MAGAAVVEIQTTRPPTNPKPYLYGVQGLRTVAALMVAVYHIWFHRVSGGVNVFFVVAGYFATASMAKIVTQPESRQRLAGVGAYLLRTARRVVPSATVVIVATVGASILLMSPSLWEANTAHGFASMFFFENWHLISEGNDYLANDLSASPFQQFWALAIQVQSYVIFPLLALIAAAMARLLRTTYRRHCSWWPGWSSPPRSRSRPTSPRSTRRRPTSTSGAGSGSSSQALCWPWPSDGSRRDRYRSRRSVSSASSGGQGWP